MKFSYFVVIFCSIYFNTAHSFENMYFANNSLRDELKDDSSRRLNGLSSWFIAGVDADVYYRTSGSKEFFHGGGYWFNLRTETEPSKNIVINTRSIFYRGSVSYGYQKSHNSYHLVGVSLKEQNLFNNWKIKGRALDLENQTFGAGLLIQNHRVPGVQGFILNSTIYLKALKEGTGGLVLADDLDQLEVGLNSGFFKLGRIGWSGDEQFDIQRDPYYYISSEYNTSGLLGYKLEVGDRINKKAYMLKIISNLKLNQFKIRTILQKRLYEKDFSKDLMGYTEAFYQTYETYDDDFTSPHNVMVFGNEVEVEAVRLKLLYEFTEKHSLFGDYEFSKFREISLAKSKSFEFYKFGYKYHFNDLSNTMFKIFLSNKVLNDSEEDPLDLNATSLYTFQEYSIIGANGAFSF